MSLILLGILILAPLAFGLLLLACKTQRLRQIVTLLAGGVLSATALLLSFQPSAVLSLPMAWTTVGTLAEAAVTLVVVTIGRRIRSLPITLMGLGQLALLAGGTWMARSEPLAGPEFVLDPLSVLMVLIISIIGSLICLYAPGYMAAHAAHSHASPGANRRFFFVLVAFLGLMNGLVLADNLSWLGTFWEATTLCSYFLIGHEGTVEAKACARRALRINTFGGLALSLGAFLVFYRTGSESLSHLSAGIAVVPLALFILATMTKSAQLPFQSWLLGAMVAPTPVSALLHSSTMVKAGSYLILRLAPGLHATPLAPVVAFAGAFTFAIACALAISQANGKKVLAYSTIANLGLIMACAGINTPLAFAAALLVLAFHALSKALLFLCVGTIEQTIGSRHIEDMGGILFKMPLTTSVAIIGMVSMMLPPFGMLIGKWMAIEASVHAPVVMLLLIAGSALTVFFWAKWIGRITTASFHPVYKIEPVSPWMIGTLVTMTAGVVVCSVGAMPLYHTVFKPMSLAAFAVHRGDMTLWTLLESVESFLAWPLFALLGMVALAVLISTAFFRVSQVRPPFLCGENMENPESSYEFRSLGDRKERALVMSYYLSPIFNEAAITAWCNPVAVLIILTLFGVLAP